ncbi:MAG: DUF6174 domain-containing protein [Gemmatimonadaceae bacterium]
MEGVTHQELLLHLPRPLLLRRRAFQWVRLTVVHSTVSNAEILRSELPNGRKSEEFRRPTIDSLFAWISAAYDRKSDRVDVKYDPKYHFPASAQLDWRTNVIDDEFSFDVLDFSPSEGPGTR